MSVMYGGAPGDAGYQPAGRVNFGWIGEAWRLFGLAAGVWVLGVLIYGLVSNLINGLIIHLFANPGYAAPPGPFGGTMTQFGIQYGTNSNVTALGQALGALFAWIYGAFQAASLYHLAVKQVRREPVAFGDLFGGGPYFVNMLILNLITFVLYVAGFLVFCVGILAVGAFLLPASALVADGRSVGEALSQSFAGMKRDWLNAALFLVVFALLILASVIPCGLGLFVTVPMVYLVGVLACRDMVGMPGIGQTTPDYGAASAPGVWPPAPGAWPPPPSQQYPPPQGFPAQPQYPAPPQDAPPQDAPPQDAPPPRQTPPGNTLDGVEQNNSEQTPPDREG